MADTTGNGRAKSIALAVSLAFGLLAGSWGLYGTIGPVKQIADLRADVQQLQREVRDMSSAFNRSLGMLEGQLMGRGP